MRGLGKNMPEKGFSAEQMYPESLIELAAAVKKCPAPLKVWLTSPAAWPKWRNFAAVWPTDNWQRMPLDQNAMQHSNEIVWEVIRDEFYFPVMDAYWMTLTQSAGSSREASRENTRLGPIWPGRIHCVGD
jgi:hypothetical protein